MFWLHGKHMNAGDYVRGACAPFSDGYMHVHAYCLFGQAKPFFPPRFVPYAGFSD